MAEVPWVSLPNPFPICHPQMLPLAYILYLSFPHDFNSVPKNDVTLNI